MQKKSTSRSGFFNLRALLVILLCAATAYFILIPTRSGLAFLDAPSRASRPAAAGLTFEERVSYQRAIEDVYWRHRIWPKDRPDPKPSLDAVMSQAQLEKKVADYLRKSQALEEYWQRPITANQLQAEMDRMAQHTKQPDVLQELFEALGNNPLVIAECLARSLLADRLLQSVEDSREGSGQPNKLAGSNSPGGTGFTSYELPIIATTPCTEGVCVDDTWTDTTLVGVPTARIGHTAVWTGSEMIVWGGNDFGGGLNTGGRYEPSTDSWTTTSTANAPEGRTSHTAVWTGSEMIVWGGQPVINTGGRYNPIADNWTPTSIVNAPDGRFAHTAVWTGSEMIVWGGFGSSYLNTGGKYNPSTDSWTATSTSNAPTSRDAQTAIWTGSEMIVWGGFDDVNYLNTGGRYNPIADNWTDTNTANAPSGRHNHSAVWTGNEMIVWGGFGGAGGLRTGGKYNPATNSWMATATTSAPSGRDAHTAVWTGTEMIVWGGLNPDYLRSEEHTSDSSHNA